MDHTYNDDTRLTEAQRNSSPNSWLGPKYTSAEAALWRAYQGLSFTAQAVLKDSFAKSGYVTGRAVNQGIADMKAGRAEAPAPAAQDLMDMAGEMEPDTGDDGTEYASLNETGLENPLLRRRSPLSNPFMVRPGDLPTYRG